VVFGVLLLVIANTSSAMTITELPVVAADLNLNIDLEIGSFANPASDFIVDVLNSSDQLEPMTWWWSKKKKNKKHKKKKDGVTLTPISEPATWLLLGSGLGGLALYRKLRKK
jgi:hypothetical protein